MEIKVREVGGSEEKSVQEVEKELLDKHEESIDETPKEDEVKEAVQETKAEEPVGMTDNDVLSFIKDRYDREIGSMDELLAEREAKEELPDDVASYLKYKKETGRGINDYVRLHRDFDSMDPDSLLKEYFMATEEGLDSEDIEAMMDDFIYDEDLDDESDVKKVKLAKKKTIAKAKKYFEEQKESYAAPLESSRGSVSEEEKKEIETYKQYIAEAETQKKEGERRREWFSKKTEELFDSEFKGFEFKLNDDKVVTFSPGDADQLKKAQETPMNFISKYLNEEGMITDAAGYHRALAMAMNPEKFAKFFYEQGKSEATEEVMRKTKNVNMTERRAPEVTSKSGTTVRSLSNDSGRGLKIRSSKNRS